MHHFDREGVVPLNALPSYDVVVAGSGPLGPMVAIAAATTGARTLLVEQNGYVVGRAAIGPPRGKGSPEFNAKWIVYDLEVRKYLALEMLPESGVAGSPAIDGGTSTGAPAVDLEGRPRVGQPDIGAYERWVPTSQVCVPLTLR